MARQLQNHLQDCYEVRKTTDATLIRLEKKVDTITQLPMRTLKWIGGLIVGAVVTILVQNFMLSQEAAQKAAQTQLAASQSAASAASANQKLNVLTNGTVP